MTYLARRKSPVLLNLNDLKFFSFIANLSNSQLPFSSVFLLLLTLDLFQTAEFFYIARTTGYCKTIL